LTLVSILLILVGHFIGDFILQWSWMANGKSKSDVILLQHVAVYTAAMTFIGLFALPSLLVVEVFMWGLANGAFHFLTDRVSSRVTSRLWHKQKVREFFMVIGLDQLVHYATLFATAVFILS
jgi:hypothetical protein